jgi:1-acyl-sn-glycerol-3-phosphate acyltransferase
LRAFDFFMWNGMCLFARLWHCCAATANDPLPASGPAIVVANHPCHADPAFLLASCKRLLHFLQARECYDLPLLRHLFARAGCIPVTRAGAEISGIRRALHDLEHGAVLGIFPEGDVNPAPDGSIHPAKPGAALLALRSHAPVYPAWIAGGPRGRDLLRAWLWPSGGVRVIFGPPLELRHYYGRPINHELLQEVSGLVARRIAELEPHSNGQRARRG